MTIIRISILVTIHLAETAAYALIVQLFNYACNLDTKLSYNDWCIIYEM